MPAPRAVVAQHEVRLVVAEPAPLALGIIVVVLIDVVGRGDGLLRRATRATHRPGADRNCARSPSYLSCHDRVIGVSTRFEDAVREFGHFFERF